MSRGFAAETSPPRCSMKGSIIVGTILALEFFSCRIGASALLPDMVQCPLTVLHGRLYVRATLQGQAQSNWWLVDTGSPWSLVNADQVRRLGQSNSGISEQVATKDGRTFSVLKGIGINIAGQAMGPFDFVRYPSLGAIDANRNSRVGYERPFQTGGVLGLNFLVQHRARFNFPAQSLFLAAGSGSSGPSPERFEGFTAVPIQITAIPRIEVFASVGSRLYSFLVDTGSYRSVIDWKIKETNQIPVRPSGILYFGLVDRTVLTAMGDLQNFQLGTLDVSKKFVQFASLGSSLRGFSHPFGGIIGEDFLWAHQAILDIGGRTFYLK
jgi:predicted aspartyl protease